MVSPTWSWLLTQWSLEPSVVIGLLLLSAGYLYAGMHLLPRDPVSGQRACTGAHLTFFVASVLVLIIALLSPLDYVGDQFLFSAHMIQHLLLATVWPPLFLLSLPAAMVRPIICSPLVGSALRLLTLPVVAFVVFNADICLWHIPGWYDLTLQNEGIHILEHLTFMGAGLLVWWPVLSPIPEMRLSYPGQLIYLFANLFPSMALGIIFAFYPRPLYSPYVSAPRLWGISALQDQQIGGLIMWMPGNIPGLAAIVALFIMWIDKGKTTADWIVGVRRREEPSRP